MVLASQGGAQGRCNLETVVLGSHIKFIREVFHTGSVARIWHQITVTKCRAVGGRVDFWLVFASLQHSKLGVNGTDDCTVTVGPKENTDRAPKVNGSQRWAQSDSMHTDSGHQRATKTRSFTRMVVGECPCRSPSITLVTSQASKMESSTTFDPESHHRPAFLSPSSIKYEKESLHF